MVSFHCCVQDLRVVELLHYSSNRNGKGPSVIVCEPKNQSVSIHITQEPYANILYAVVCCILLSYHIVQKENSSESEETSAPD